MKNIKTFFENIKLGLFPLKRNKFRETIPLNWEENGNGKEASRKDFARDIKLVE